MERGNPAKGRMTALYDLVDKLFEGKDVFYADEEIEEPEEKGATRWA